MRIPRLLLHPVSFSLALSITLLTGCGKGKETPPGIPSPTAAPSPSSTSSAPPVVTPLPSGDPVLVIKQTPEVPRPGVFPQHPRGLVVALWADGRMVRCVDDSTVGKSYVTGTVPEKERDELLKYLQSSEVKGAPKVPHLRLHAATLVTTIRTDGANDKWTTELPNDSSVWLQLRSRLLGIPLVNAGPAGEGIVRDASKED